MWGPNRAIGQCDHFGGRESYGVIVDAVGGGYDRVGSDVVTIDEIRQPFGWVFMWKRVVYPGILL
jgi:hypothetical protein